MTQPPSQQPPQPGFGAPQDPQQGAHQPPAQPPQMPPAPQGPPQTPPTAPPGAPAPGYGYPQQPPAQPGYGYPLGAPPGPHGPGGQSPGQPGPYNQPQGPYNQPAGPYNQPGPYGGYPTQPQYPGAPTPGGGSGGGFFKGRTGVIVAAAAAALLVVGGGTWFALSGDDKEDKPNVSKSSDDPKPTGSESVDQGDGSGTGGEGDEDLNAGRKDGEAKVLFLTKNDIDLPRNGADVFGPWVNGDTVVKAMYREVAGYSVTDGQKKWSVPLPADVCSASVQSSNDGKIVVGVKDGLTDKAKCNDLQMIDMNTGKAGWKKSIPKPSGIFASLADYTLSISGKTLAVGGGSNSYGYDVVTGKQLFGTPKSGCEPFAYAGGTKLIAGAACDSDPEKPKHQVQQIDPATGKPQWTYNTPEGWEIDKVYSVSPLVVSITQREPEKKWSIIALTDNGKLRSQIAGGKSDKFQPRCGGAFVIFGQNLEGCTGVAADAKHFYMATETEYGKANELVAFDLDTGKEAWRSPAGGERKMTPLRMEGGNVLVYMQPSYNTGGGVATVAPTGGAPKTLLQHPASTAEIESSFYSPKMAYADGRFFLASGRVSAPNDKAEEETKTMMGFGQ
ncbi:outer membrane protein assembly factor BamB family protein [Streptomyces xantholiticus]